MMVAHSARGSGVASGASGSGRPTLAALSRRYSLRVRACTPGCDSRGPAQPARACQRALPAAPACASRLHLRAWRSGGQR